MADESTVYSALAAYGPLTTLISTRLYDQRTPDNVSTPSRPFVILTTVSDVDQNQIQGPQIAGSFVVQMDIYAETKASAKAVLAQIRAALYPIGLENVARDLPADDPHLRRIASEWSFLLPR